MDVAEKIKIVSEQIRKKIPRTMELREGCILQNEWSKDFFKVYNETETHIRMFQLNTDIPNEQVINKKHIGTYTPLVIIGHEITLLDVMQYLKCISFSVSGCTEIDSIDFCGQIFNHHYDLFLDVEWNMSFLLLKDQSESFIDFLYNTIK